MFKPIFIDDRCNIYGSSAPKSDVDTDSYIEELKVATRGVRLTSAQIEHLMAVSDDIQKWREISVRIMYESALWDPDDTVDDTNQCTGHPEVVS
jgi:hypothetical protein